MGREKQCGRREASVGFKNTYTESFPRLSTGSSPGCSFVRRKYTRFNAVGTLSALIRPSGQSRVYKLVRETHYAKHEGNGRPRKPAACFSRPSSTLHRGGAIVPVNRASRIDGNFNRDRCSALSEAIDVTDASTSWQINAR